MISEQVTAWKARAYSLALRIGQIQDSREATREEAVAARACFREHLETLDDLLLEVYADGRRDERQERDNAA